MGYMCWASGCGTEIPGGKELWVDRSGALLPKTWVGRPADPSPRHPACAVSAPRREVCGPAEAEGPGTSAAPVSGLNLAPGGASPAGLTLGSAEPAVPVSGLNLTPGGQLARGPTLFGKPRPGQGSLW